MPTELVGAVGVVALAAAGLTFANALRDRGVDARVPRHLAGMLGGGAYLVAVGTMDAPTATALSATATLALLALRLRARHVLRGLAGDNRRRRWGEVVYAGAGTVSLAAGWLWLGDRWVGFLPIAFMAWGDNAAGLARVIFPGRTARAVLPSAAMLAACLTAAALREPYWVGAAGGLAATAAERLRPTAHPLWDDNWAVVAASLAVIAWLG